MSTHTRRQEKRIAPKTAHELLAQWPRRATLDELDGSTLSSAELADRLAHRDDAPEKANAEDIAIALHHVHLPKLREHSAVIESHGTYQLGPTAGQLEDYRR